MSIHFINLFIFNLHVNLLARGLRDFATIRAEKKLAIKQLHRNDGKYELEQYVHYKNVYHIF